jgi:hypothetical protein
MDYESLNFNELAREYEDIHGARISVNALMYRVREKGMSKTEAVQKSKDRRGEVHREFRDLLYCYLHVECAGMEEPPSVIYVGSGAEGRMFETFNRSGDRHKSWLRNWFRTATPETLHFGVELERLFDLSWLGTTDKTRYILTTLPDEQAPEWERQLIRFYSDEGHPLINKIRMKHLKV